MAEDQKWLTPGVGAVGAASLLADAGYEATTSVFPTFLTATLGASAATLGVVEGVSDALVGVMKLVGGPLANNPKRRGPITANGYLVTALSTGAIGATVTVWQAGLFRALAWMARGVRSPSRDALLSSLSPEWARGRTFGLERGVTISARWRARCSRPGWWPGWASGPRCSWPRFPACSRRWPSWSPPGRPAKTSA